MSNASDFLIENGVLKEYNGLGRDVVVPEGVTSIGNLAFKGCSSLKSITIPDGVTSIGDWAFWYCSSLTSITLPDGVTSIGDWAFSNCRSLMSITLPEGVMSIGERAFFDCKGLADQSGVVIVKGILFDYFGLGGDVVVPEGVTGIGDRAFRDCEGLRSIALPGSVTSIGKEAFSGCRSLTSVTLPEGVTSIGEAAFEYCKSLKSIALPEGVTSIGKETFYGCSSLVSIMLPDGVTSIGSLAFSGCSSLTSITLPDGATSIGDRAFRDCGSLASITLPEGVTSIGEGAFDYCKSLKSIALPEGVTSIGKETFYGCSSLVSITLPEGVTSIGDWAFRDCGNLASITLPEGVASIGREAFSGCKNLQTIKLSGKAHSLLSYNSAPKISAALAVTGGARLFLLAYSAKADRDNLQDFAKKGMWNVYDLELINNGPVYKYRMPARLLGALGRLLDSVDLTEENRALYAELLNKNAKKLVPIAEELCFPRIVADLFSLGILDAKTDKAVRKLLAASSVPELAALAETAAPAAAEKKKPAPEQTEQPAAEKDPLREKYAEKLKAIKGDAAIKKMKLLGHAMPKVLLQDGGEAPEELFRFLLASCGAQLGGEYHLVPEADEAAALLRYDSLCEAMDAVSGHLDGPSYPAVLPLLCRYGNAQQIRALTDAWKSWGDWYQYNRRGRTAQETLEAALILSDTRQAAVWLEKHGGLEKYAALRGVTVDAVYERFLFDFGFDETGKRVFELGATTLEATLTPDMKLALYDTAKGKAVRSIPKKDADPALQKKATDELADMRQNIKKAVKIKNDQLFADYIDDTETEAAGWKSRYTKNPFLHRLAELVVWAQGDRMFILTDTDAVDSAGQSYEITDEPIRIAHPMEMDAADVTAWQKYFTSHGLKQAFSQVWEPVYRKEDVRPDRYKGCRINPLYLKNQQRRGIDAEWYEAEYYWSKEVTIKGFRVEAKDAEARPDDERAYVELVRVEPIRWNRRTNMVIGYLDRITVWDRVKKDDVSVMRQMERFTLAQITEMIGLAQEANATNVLAALLEYKNAHFAGFDPMEEFTLEW